MEKGPFSVGRDTGQGAPSINYRESAEGVTEEHLQGTFFVGWPNPPSPATHLRLLQSTDHVVVAVNGSTDAVVGFVTAISDGVLAAYIPFLEVDPDYQKRGIGTELMRRMLDQLNHLYAIDLLCDEDLQPYYERLGMQRATGMLHRNYDRQSGPID
jgi:ribosomal protein S18 acetylase RimI-like enzyme